VDFYAVRSPVSPDFAFEPSEIILSDSAATPVDADYALDGASSFVDEMEQLKRQNAALDGELRAARDQFQAILDAVPGGVSWLDRDLKYLGINSNLAQTFGLAPAEFIGRRIGFLGASPAFENFARNFFDGQLDNDARELEMEVGSGPRFYFMMARKYRDGQSALFVGIDITDRKEAEDKLRRDAFYDQLTGLPNRALLLERLERALEFSRRRENYLFAVLFLDFDGFKVVNDSLGHTVGDKLLQNVARRLEGMSRASDTVSRLGGDEYVLILDGIDDLSGATHIAERIHRMMGMPFVIDGQEIFLTVSIGITVNTANYSDTEEILRDADIAMYRAKSGGRNRYEVFDRAMHDATLQRLQMETDLHRSLENRDFLLHFQPIIDLQTGELTAFEALVRWQRPRSGFTQPGDFIALAEETGLIVHLDRWVFRHACEQMRLWLDEFGPARCPQFISVNLSSRHFAYPDLVESVGIILDEPRSRRSSCAWK
jgi:diguanylate cyclase (GGDEF)-like protein/PAS domain S-box-containing protein